MDVMLLAWVVVTIHVLDLVALDAFIHVPVHVKEAVCVNAKRVASLLVTIFVKTSVI